MVSRLCKGPDRKYFWLCGPKDHCGDYPTLPCCAKVGSTQAGVTVPSRLFAYLLAQMVRNLPAVQETQVQFLGMEDFLEKGMATPLEYSCLENSTDRKA